MPQSEQSQMMPVGEQVRDLRKAKGMTIQALAEVTNRSVGYISQIERNLSVVTIPVLGTIADALGVNISWFFQGSALAPLGERDVIVRKSNRRKLDFTGTGMIEELLSPNLTGAFELVMGTFAPNAETSDEQYARTGEEAGVIIKGELELWIGDRHFNLVEGDSFTFPRSSPHRSRNPGKTDTIVLWIISPPAY